MTLTKNKGFGRNKCILLLCAILLLIGILWWVTQTISEHYLQQDPMLLKIKHVCSDLHPDVKKLKLFKANKSYTLNKNSIYLCLKDENGEYYPLNMLVYVFIHELAHFCNKEDVGHTEKFHQIFEELLDKAHEMGIYNPSIPVIDNYCGHGNED